ncbi:MAG TPA: choice-of-anchor Q domain-containing protein, partial [Promineifilum sp.]|nr:choice-of-anchor Q domain-containing protein [Promineifilum sp.]
MPVKGSIPDANGYALQSNSPAINAGRAVARVTEDFFGQSRGGVLDIGADETGGGPPPTTGQVVVTVATTPDQSAQVFSFTAGYTGNPFELTDGETHSSGQLAPGTYSVAMTPVDGWTTFATCSDGSAPGAINLAAGETVTCTFNNEEQAAEVTRIIVLKTTIPAGEAQVFQFASNFAGAFGLAHGGQKQTDVVAGAYMVTESVPEGWIQASATCNDGSTPDNINVSEGETVTCTFVNQKVIPPLDAAIYVTTTADGTVGDITFSKGDILAYDGSWSMYFDASDVGIMNNLNDFAIMPDGSLLIAISGRTTLNTSNGSFKLQSLGDNTSGYFEMYFDGSDVGLTKASEKIDALAIQPNGTLLISTYGTASVPNGALVIKAQDEDLLAFQPSSTGDNTQGVWSLALDGSTIPGLGKEDIDAVWRDGNSGAYYLTMTTDFIIGGVTGTPGTILAVTPGGTVTHYWNAADAGLTGSITGIHIVP